jgi:hypothetical protein
MEFSESLSVFYSLLISSVLDRGRTLKSGLSVLITHPKRITYRSQKNSGNRDESTDNAIKAIRRCIISLNFMPTFDMIIARASKEDVFNQLGIIT